MRRILLIALAVSLAGPLAGCAEPLAIIGDNGFLLQGTVDGLTGKFTATDGKLTCSGEDPSPVKPGNYRGPTTLTVACTDGRQGVVVVNGEAGHLRLTDGTKADFVVGAAAGALSTKPATTP
jgi:hypothetical protein